MNDARKPDIPRVWRKAAVVTRTIHASAHQVWHVMATPCALVSYHPFCTDNPVTSWPGAGSQDAVHYLSGVVLNRRFTAWTEGRGYELEIGNSEWPVSRVRWWLESKGANASELTISISPSAFATYPAVVRWTLYRIYLLPLLRRYLRAVLKGLDHYLKTGRDVEPNQFGRVRLFS